MKTTNREITISVVTIYPELGKKLWGKKATSNMLAYPVFLLIKKILQNPDFISIK